MKIQKQSPNLRDKILTLFNLLRLNLKTLIKNIFFWIQIILIVITNLTFYILISKNVNELGFPRRDLINYFGLANCLLFGFFAMFLCLKFFNKKNSKNLMTIELRLGYGEKFIFFIRLILIWILGWAILIILCLLSMIFLPEYTLNKSIYLTMVSKYCLVWLLVWLLTTSIIIFLQMLVGQKNTSIICTTGIILFASFTSIVPTLNINRQKENDLIINEINSKVNFAFELFMNFKEDKNLNKIFYVENLSEKIQPYIHESYFKKTNFYNSFLGAPDVNEVFICGNVFKKNQEENFILQELSPNLFDVILNLHQILVEKNLEKLNDYNRLINFLFERKIGFQFFDEKFWNNCNVQSDEKIFDTYSRMLTRFWVYSMQNPWTTVEIKIYKEPEISINSFGLNPIRYKDYKRHFVNNRLLAFLNPQTWFQTYNQQISKDKFFNNQIINSFYNQIPILTSFNLENVSKQMDELQSGEANDSFDFNVSETYLKNKFVTTDDYVTWFIIYITTTKLSLIVGLTLLNYKFLKKYLKE